MSRRRKALHRSILPDPRFKSVLVTELVGVVLKQGKKTIAEQIVYTALDLLDKKVEGKETPLEKFEICLENIKPRVEVKSRRVGGANYQVPMEVAPDRAKALALRWLLDAARNRNEPNMADRLAAELVAPFLILALAQNYPRERLAVQTAGLFCLFKVNEKFNIILHVFLRTRYYICMQFHETC